MGTGGVSDLRLDTNLLRHLEKHQIIGESALFYRHVPFHHHHSPSNKVFNVGRSWKWYEVLLET